MQNPSYYPQHLTYPFSNVGLSSNYDHHDHPQSLLFKNCENSSESPNHSNSSSPIPKQVYNGHFFNKRVLQSSSGLTSGGVGVSQYKDPSSYGPSYCKDNKFIKSGDESNMHGGRKERSSFSIDSLLGLSNIASAAMNMQSGHHSVPFLPNQLCGMNLIAAMNCWSQYPHNSTPHSPRASSKELETKRDIRFHPFNQSNPSVSLSKSNSEKAKTLNRNITEKPEDALQTSRRVGKTKRIRTIFTPEQLERLEKEFERQQYMVGPERLYLASALSLTEAQVKVWFQNRRIKWRKQHLELQQQRLAAIRSQQMESEYESESEFGSSIPTPTPSVDSSPATDMPESNFINPSMRSFNNEQNILSVHQTEILISDDQIPAQDDQTNKKSQVFVTGEGENKQKLLSTVDVDYC